MTEVAITIGAVGSLAVVLAFINSRLKESAKAHEQYCPKQGEIAKIHTRLAVVENNDAFIKDSLVKIEATLKDLYDKFNEMNRLIPKRKTDDG